MRQNQLINDAKTKCRNTSCIECEGCKAINFEENRTAKLEINFEIKSLYGAESLSYYFYYLSGANRVHR